MPAMTPTSECRDCPFSPRCLPGLMANFGCCKTCVYKIDCHKVFGGLEKAIKLFKIATDEPLRAYIKTLLPSDADNLTRDDVEEIRMRALCKKGHDIREKLEVMRDERDARMRAYVEGTEN